MEMGGVLFYVTRGEHEGAAFSENLHIAEMAGRGVPANAAVVFTRAQRERMFFMWNLISWSSTVPGRVNLGPVVNAFVFFCSALSAPATPFCDTQCRRAAGDEGAAAPT